MSRLIASTQNVKNDCIRPARRLSPTNVRLLAGIGINVSGAAVLLSETLRFFN